MLVPTREEDAFDLDPDEVEKRLTPASKVLLLITPSNPTAGIVTPANIRRLAEIAQERNLIVISDEIYEKFLYDDHQHLSIGLLARHAGADDHPQQRLEDLRHDRLADRLPRRPGAHRRRRGGAEDDGQHPGANGLAVGRRRRTGRSARSPLARCARPTTRAAAC